MQDHEEFLLPEQPVSHNVNSASTCKFESNPSILNRIVPQVLVTESPQAGQSIFRSVRKPINQKVVQDPGQHSQIVIHSHLVFSNVSYSHFVRKSVIPVTVKSTCLLVSYMWVDWMFELILKFIALKNLACIMTQLNKAY